MFTDGQIRSVADLKRYLKENALSPENLAQRTSISNMTIRRLLARDGHTLIPPRYHAQLDRLLPRDPVVQGHLQALSVDLDSLFGHVRGLAAQNTRSVSALATETSKYLRSCSLKDSLRPLIQRIVQQARKQHPLASRSLALGALIYFLSPVDFIPDITAITGFLDDFAVLSLVDYWLEAKASLVKPHA